MNWNRRLTVLSLQKQFEKVINLIQGRNWRQLNFFCEQYKLDPIIMSQFKDYLDWRTISQYQDLNMNFIREMKDYVDWDRIWEFQKHISEDFIDEFIDKADWWSICLFRNLSEKFMEKHIDEMKWDIISTNQEMSEEFMERHIDQIMWERFFAIKNNPNKLSYYFINKYKDSYLKDYETFMEVDYDI